VALIEDLANGDQVYCNTHVGPDGSYVPAHVYRCPDGVGSWLIGEFDPAFGNDTPGDPNDCTLIDVAINEIRIDQPSSDNDEYFELVGDPDAALDGLTYIVIGDGAAASGVVEAVIPLTGMNIQADGFVSVGEATMTLWTPDYISDVNFENSDNVTHLLLWGFSGALDDDLDVDDDGILDFTPWVEVVDCVALIEDLDNGDQVYCDTHVGPDGSYVPGHVYRCPDKVGCWIIGAFDPAGGDDTPGDPNTAPSPSVTINEIRIDQPGDDNDEYFELAGDPDTSLGCATYIVIGDGSGGSGSIEAVIDLCGLSIQADGFLCVAEDTMTIAVPDAIASLNFENSDNVTHLLVTGFYGAYDDDLDTDDDGVLDSMPWASVLDCIALIEDPAGGDHVYCTTQIGPDGSYVPSHVRRCPDGDGNWVMGQFDIACGSDTPGDPNECTEATATFRNDAGDTNLAGYVAEPVIIAEYWSATVDLTATTNSIAGVVGFSAAAETYWANADDYILVDLAAAPGEVLGLPLQAGSGVLTFGRDIPCDCVLPGFFAATQAFSVGGSDGITLHNAYDLVVGTY
jgi:hypothetical protein